MPEWQPSLALIFGAKYSYLIKLANIIGASYMANLLEEKYIWPQPGPGKNYT